MTRNGPALAAVIIGLSIGAVMMLPGVTGGPSFDAAVFTAIGDRLVAGELPYLEAWDHKPPAIYLANAVVQAILGRAVGHWVSVWMLSVTVAGAIAAVTATILARLAVGDRWAVLGGGVAAVIASLYVISLGGGLTEPLATLPLAAALLWAVSARGSLWVSGGLAGLALLTSLLAGPGVVAIGVFLMLYRGRGALARYAMGASIPIVVAGAVTLLAGALPAALDALLAYGVAYRSISQASEATLAHAEAAVVTIGLVWAVIPAAVGALAWFREPKGSRYRHLAIAFVVWVVLTIAVSVYLGRFETHYAAPLAIPFAILATAGTREFVSRRQRSRAGFALMSGAWLMATSVSIAVLVPTTAALSAANAAEGARTRLVAEYVAANTDPNDRIWVWGNEPHLYYLAERGPASRFIYLLPLTTVDYATPDLIDEVLAEWEERPPALIVDAGSLEPGSPGAPPLLIARPPDCEARSYDILEPLREFVRDRYAEAAIVDGWPIYRLGAVGSR